MNQNPTSDSSPPTDAELEQALLLHDVESARQRQVILKDHLERGGRFYDSILQRWTYKPGTEPHEIGNT